MGSLGLTDVCVRDRFAAISSFGSASANPLHPHGRRRLVRTNAVETDRHSYASHAVLTAPPPESVAIRTTPGTQMRDSRLLTTPGHKRTPRYQWRPVQDAGPRKEDLTERMRPLCDELVGNDRAELVKEEQVGAERNEREGERASDSGPGALC